MLLLSTSDFRVWPVWQSPWIIKGPCSNRKGHQECNGGNQVLIKLGVATQQYRVNRASKNWSSTQCAFIRVHDSWGLTANYISNDATKYRGNHTRNHPHGGWQLLLHPPFGAQHTKGCHGKGIDSTNGLGTILDSKFSFKDGPQQIGRNGCYKRDLNVNWIPQPKNGSPTRPH